MPKKKAEIPIRHLTVLQLKSNIELPTQVLKQPASLMRVELRPDCGVDGTLFIRNSRTSLPSWVAFLEQGTVERLPQLVNASTAAVLFVKTGDALLAYCFGRGRSFLRPDALEFDFGLRVALNAVDPEKLRSLDSRAFEQMTFQTRRQASRATSLRSFGLDVASDLLRSVTGEPRDTSLAVRITGRDALVLESRLTFEQLQSQAAKLIEIRDSTEYRREFDWVDDLKMTRDRSMLDRLQQNLTLRRHCAEVLRRSRSEC